MGYMYVIGNCISCGIMFTFNADWVPSVFVDGTREPICADCIRRINVERKRLGLPAAYIHPDAYEPGEVP